MFKTFKDVSRPNFALFKIVLICILALNCSVLSCGDNGVCVNVGNIYKCVCKSDYTGADCGKLGKSFDSLIRISVLI